MSAIPQLSAGSGPDPAYALVASGNLRRRQAKSRAFEVVTLAAAGIAVLMLLILVYYAASRGLSQLSFSFLFGTLPLLNGSVGPLPGGIGPALAGTVELSLIGTIVALPVGVLTAIYVSEFSGPRGRRVVETYLNLMAGLPTIIAGVFIALLIANNLGQSAIAGGLALAIVEVPLIARASLESISRVPGTLREAADALGVARWRTVLGVILPTASNSIVTATILAVARAAGETAPLLFTCTLFSQNYAFNPLHSVASVPLELFSLMESGDPQAVDKAWGAAFLLMVTILIVNILARVWLRRSERKRGL
ncbi:MAG TPA: phosphate ABC transporter permease PstA [Solirubrobacteraceae bacterium]|jgi:phosphate transport system permease protein|nr:phosphate ABC transporter permease PstA [Solirubrobacteraceae bacterium]